MDERSPVGDGTSPVMDRSEPEIRVHGVDGLDRIDGTVPDVDVAVVGAGPAGLAAAIRCRFPKGFGAMASSVLLFDPASPGGLASWKGPRLTGPAWTLDGESFLAPLLADVEDLAIPLRSALVDELRPRGRRWCCLSRGRVLARARAVILATGFRPLADEGPFLGGGLHLAYRGLDHVPALLEAALKDARGGRLLVFGREGTEALLPFVDALRPADVAVTWVLDLPDPSPPAAFAERDVVAGRLAGIEGETRPATAFVDVGHGAPRALSCRALFLDYLAFESRAPRLPRLPDVGRDGRGFPLADGEGRCLSKDGRPVPGLHVAGDATGGRAFVLKALADGVTAGLSAHVHVHRSKFGETPSLFAYAPPPAHLAIGSSPWPRFRPDDRLRPLLPPRPFFAASRKLAARPPMTELPRDIAELRTRIGNETWEDWLHRHLDGKLLTVERDDPAESPRRDDDRKRHADTGLDEAGRDAAGRDAARDERFET